MFKRISLHDLQRALANTHNFIYTAVETKFHSSTQWIQAFAPFFIFVVS